MATKLCSNCQAETDTLALFPNDLCLECYRPIGDALAARMTAADLTAMWGGGRRRR